MGPFLLAFQEKIQKFWQRILAVLSVAILSSVLAVSPASAQFLSDGVTPVTPIPSNAVFRIAIAACVSEAPVTGACPIYGDGSGYRDMENWGTSNVTDMSSMFESANAFNGDIKNWNTSNVTTFESTFYDATAFNQDIGGWITTSATNMEATFQDAVFFNQDLSQWNTANVTASVPDQPSENLALRCFDNFLSIFILAVQSARCGALWAFVPSIIWIDFWRVIHPTVGFN